jgi:hypothetical protein
MVDMSDILEKVEFISDDDAKSIINFLRKKAVDSRTVEDFIADFLNPGQYCIVGQEVEGECKPATHRLVLEKFIANLDSLMTAANDVAELVVNQISSKVKTQEIRPAKRK